MLEDILVIHRQKKTIVRYLRIQVMGLEAGCCVDYCTIDNVLCKNRLTFVWLLSL